MKIRETFDHNFKNIPFYIPSMNIHEHSKNVIGQLLLAE